MITRPIFRVWLLIVLIGILALTPLQPASAQTGSEGTPTGEGDRISAEELGVLPVTLSADPSTSDFFQAPPAEFMQAADEAQSLASTGFIIDYRSPGQYSSITYGGSNLPCLTFPDQAKQSFNYAASIWTSILDTPKSIPIHIEACWVTLGNSSILGAAMPLSFRRDFANAPASGTWYPSALANNLVGIDIEPGNADIAIVYNNDVASKFYYATAPSHVAPLTQLNFASVVLHEITHGLGFSGSMYVSGGIGEWGVEDNYGYLFPVAYDRLAISAGTPLLNYPNYSSQLAAALTNENVYFTGANAVQANNGVAVKLYAPYSWVPGSSYSHLDESFNGTSNALMTYALSYGESNYDPGPVTKGILMDVGWPIQDITLSNNQVSENLGVGSLVGTFSSGLGSGVTYSLNACAGTDNALFQINGTTLATAAILDAEAAPVRSICVRAAAPSGLYKDKWFQISVSNVNEPATKVLRPIWVRPGTLAGAPVGKLYSDDRDAGDVLTYTLIPNAADPEDDSAKFEIKNNDRLYAKEAISSNKGDTYTIYVNVQDQAGLGPATPTKLTLTVSDIYDLYLPVTVR